MVLELVNQFLDCLLADVIVLLDSRVEQSLDPEVNFTAFPVSLLPLCLLEWSKDVVASEVVVFKFGFSSILCGTVRDWYVLLYTFLLTS